MAGYAFLLILALTSVAFVLGRTYASGAIREGAKLHSVPGYHGAFVAVWVGLPALVLVLLWLFLQGPVVDRLILASLPSEFTASLDPSRLTLVLSEIKNVASGNIFGEPAPEIVAAAERFVVWDALARWSMLVVVLAVMLLAMFLARSRLRPRFRARNGVEKALDVVMIFSAISAVLITVGIVLSLVFEAARFFRMVPFWEFLFGLRWEPQMPIRADQVAGLGAFGAVPVFTGTLLIASIALAVAIPVGLFTAIYLIEYANEKIRVVVKPVMEVLAGIPTVVYGFFAVLVIAPSIRAAGLSVGLLTSPSSALAAGLVMGIMIIPFISSLSDDALRAVPRSMRDGSLALGATRAETMKRVLIPAALPGIMGGVLLAASRAIGETMIVVMAAGLIATLTLNPLDGVTTVTVQIVTLLIGDTAFDSPKTLAAFALGLVLFLVTLGINILALSIVRRFREKYD